jgi:DNA polymerase III epsilon subunit-like protein
MCYQNKLVEAVPIKEALTGFFNFIGDTQVLLVGHSIKPFDCHVLLNTAKSCGMLGVLDRLVAGYLDTLVLFKSTPQGF